MIVNYLAFGVALPPTQWVGLVTLAGTVTWMGMAGRRGPAAVGIETLEVAPVLVTERTIA